MARKASRARWWNSTRLGLDPVAALEPAQPGHRVDVEDDGQVRPQVAGGPAQHVLELGGVEPAPDALVGERGVDVAVGDHHRTAGQGRDARPSRRARPCRRRTAAPRCGRSGGRWRGRGRSGGSPCRPGCPPARRSAARRGPPRVEPLGEQAGLGRLARPLAALEAHEDAGGGVLARVCSRGEPTRRRRPSPQRVRRVSSSSPTSSRSSSRRSSSSTSWRPSWSPSSPGRARGARRAARRPARG